MLPDFSMKVSAFTAEQKIIVMYVSNFMVYSLSVIPEKLWILSFTVVEIVAVGGIYVAHVRIYT